MQSDKKTFEKKLLIAFALLAMAVSGWFIYQSTTFGDRLQDATVTPKKDLGLVPTDKVKAATEILLKKFNWASPERNNKPVPLNKSVLVILKDGELYDLSLPPPKPQLRDPITNEFIVKNGLPNYLSPNFGELDPDDDGFSNAEEFAPSTPPATNPSDPQSHPPLHDHLYFKQRITNDYILTLNSNSPPFAILRTAPSRANAYVELPFPKAFGYRESGVSGAAAERFEAEKFEQKTIPDPKIPGGSKDVSEMTVLDRATNSRFVLVYREPKNLAEYEAVFEFWHKPESKYWRVKKGESFYIPGVAQKYKLIDIQENSAVVSLLNGDGTEGAPLTIKPR
jgi:hypothetical protein